MTILSIIEAALKAIEQARFQELADTYLHRRGYEQINVVGRLVGAQKTRKGRPDTFFLKPNGKYVFAEYTTQQTQLAAKLLDDIQGCFDPDDHLPAGAVDEVVLGYTGHIEPAEVESLRAECAKHGATLSLYSLHRIAQDLYASYPGLARDFLGVQIDTAQIVSLDEFVEAYEASPVSTPLTTTLKFRDDELTELVKAIEGNSIVLVTGPAGVGKTRLAIEACRKFAESDDGTILRAIRNVHVDLYADLRVHLGPDGSYLIFVDDANRIARFEYLCSFFAEPRASRQIRIVATVRDYALDATHRAAKVASSTALVKLLPFSDQQIRDLVSEEFEIKNNDYQNRIARIAKGNPRLAVMAARVARETNTLESIADASGLYDQYFESLRREIEKLDDPALLRAAFIVALFRRLEKSNEEQMRTATQLAGLSSAALWEAVGRLHRAEVVDIHEDEVARVADQVLATYLVYLAVFRKKVVSLKTIIVELLPTRRRPLIDLLAPVVNVFHGEDLDAFLRTEANAAWQDFERAGNRDAIWELMDAFWFVRPAETLSELSREIEAIQTTTVVAAEIEFEKQGSTDLGQVLSILAHFRAEPTLFPAAVDLVLRYLEQSQGEGQAVYRLLTHTFGITHRTHFQGFEAERVLLEKLWERTRGGDDELFSLLYIAVAEPFLKTHFSPSESFSDDSLTIYQYDPPATPEFLSIRERLWNRLFLLLERSAIFRARVVGLLQKHAQSGYEVGNTDVVAYDAAVVLPLARAQLQPTNFRECLAVRDYLDLLERLKVPSDSTVADHFSTETFRLSELLLVDRLERLAMGRKAYEAQQQEEWANAAADLKTGDSGALLGRCAEIQAVVRGGHREYQFQQNLKGLLLAVAARDATLFEELVRELLRSPGALAIEPFPVVLRLIEQVGVEQTYEILKTADSTLRIRWLLAYFFLLPAAAVTVERAHEVCKLYGEAPSDQLIYGLAYLLKYLSADPAIVVKVTEALLRKEEVRVGAIFSGAFDHEEGLAEQLPSLYHDRVDLLKQAYVAGAKADRHSDMEAAIFNTLLDLDPHFISEWVRFIYWNHRWPSDHDDDRDYASLWSRADYFAVMSNLIRTIAERHRDQGFLGGYFLVFFKVPSVGAESLRQRQDEFLSQFIAENAPDDALMEAVFSAVSQFDADRRRQHIGTFLTHNTNVGSFERLALEPHSWGGSGSFVPTLQGRIDFLESLLPMLSSGPLLGHRVIIEKHIAALNAEIVWEKKRDFLRG